MKKPILIISCVLLFSNAWALSGKSGEIILTDGSKIYGNVVSLKNGIYEIKSDTLGTLHIDETKIDTFDFKSSGGGETTLQNKSKPETGSKNVSGIQSLQDQILSDDRLMEMIIRLQSDPVVQSIINNPDLKKAIDTGDINTLLNNPEILKLMSNKIVKEIQNELNGR